MNAVGRAAIPRHEPRHERPRDAAHAEAADVLIVSEREAAHRVDVADVERIGPETHALRPRRRRAHDQIVRREVERLERGRIERREIAKVTRRARQALQCGRVHARGVDQIARYRPIVERGVHGRVRIEVGDVPEDALRAAALIEIVVNERDGASGYWL